MLKINLGCGNYIKEGYINIDIRQLPGVNVVADIFNLPFRDKSIGEIIAMDIYEHISHQKSQELLKHWVSKLKDKGLLFIQTPSINRIVEYFSSCKSLDMIEKMIALIFGDQDYSHNYHYTIGHPVLMDYYLKQAGIKGIIEYKCLGGINLQFRAYK